MTFKYFAKLVAVSSETPTTSPVFIVRHQPVGSRGAFKPRYRR